ncbi:PqiC family protein [Desulfobulbus oralis]|uniref:ABC-type transport auxiliary lipoprotein component domain-containing protein n=1 Tax=Desulfobulbus oralis TaxID=1986146 RepID=A0A2L1GPD4_9BACT|nr:PqiC family protein [Desulfobulbus oralis]AVD71487.1 hypothetical protein CAY53_08425 [Desulfobulbus oralis]
MMRQPLPFLFACLLSLALTGCLGKAAPDTLYALEPLTGTDTAPGAELSGMIMIMPVRLPPQLQSRGIVMEQGTDGPQMLVGRLWAGPLDEQMGAKLVADLQTLLHSPNVALYPGPRYSRPLYQVETEIIRFSGDDSTFTLRAVSTISSPNERRILSRETFSQSVRLDGQGARAYVAAASQALDAFSRKLAATLTTLPKTAASDKQPAARNF